MPGSEFTRDFECLVAWLATRTDKSTIKRMLRIDWDTVGRIVKRVCDAELDPGRLDDLYEIGIDEVSWKRQHKYLTLVVDHHRRQVVWGCEGSGQAAADEFFSELDPPPADDPPEHAKQPRAASEPAIMVPFGPCPTVPAGHGIPGAWLQPGLEIEPAMFARAGLLQAVSMDMGPGYAKSVREHAPQAIVCIDPYHVVQLANQALDEVRRAYWNELRSLGDQDAAKRFKDSRWSLLKKPDKLTDEQATTLTRIKAAGGEVWRAYTLKEAVRGIFEPGLSIEDVEVLINGCSAAWPAAASNRSSGSAKRSASTTTGSSPRSASASTKAAPKRSTTRSASSPAAPTASTPPRPRSPSSCSPAGRSPSTSHTSYTRSGSGDTDHIDAERAQVPQASPATHPPSVNPPIHTWRVHNRRSSLTSVLPVGDAITSTLLQSPAGSARLRYRTSRSARRHLDPLGDGPAGARLASPSPP